MFIFVFLVLFLFLKIYPSLISVLYLVKFDYGSCVLLITLVGVVNCKLELLCWSEFVPIRWLIISNSSSLHNLRALRYFLISSKWPIWSKGWGMNSGGVGTFLVYWFTEKSVKKKQKKILFTLFNFINDL